MEAARQQTDFKTLTGPARASARILAIAPESQRNAALRSAAVSLRTHSADILVANARDVASSKASAAFIDRLTLTPARIEAMAKGLEAIALLPDPVGRIMAEWTRPNGLLLRRVATPLGVIGMIYESRPNVGADAAGLCIKSGNAVILRGGSESLNSARCIQSCIQEGLEQAGLPRDCVQIVPDADRAHVASMLSAAGEIDMIILAEENPWSSGYSGTPAFRCWLMLTGFVILISTKMRILAWHGKSWRMQDEAHRYLRCYRNPAD